MRDLARSCAVLLVAAASLLAPGAGAQADAVRSRRNALLAELSREPATRDELSRRLRRRPDQLALDLLELELDAEIVRDRDGRWGRAPRRR